jgi:hypothetical protein
LYVLKVVVNLMFTKKLRILWIDVAFRMACRNSKIAPKMEFVLYELIWCTLN